MPSWHKSSQHTTSWVVTRVWWSAKHMKWLLPWSACQAAVSVINYHASTMLVALTSFNVSYVRTNSTCFLFYTVVYFSKVGFKTSLVEHFLACFDIDYCGVHGYSPPPPTPLFLSWASRRIVLQRGQKLVKIMWLVLAVKYSGLLKHGD